MTAKKTLEDLGFKKNESLPKLNEIEEYYKFIDDEWAVQIWYDTRHKTVSVSEMTGNSMTLCNMDKELLEAVMQRFNELMK